MSRRPPKDDYVGWLVQNQLDQLRRDDVEDRRWALREADHADCGSEDLDDYWADLST